MSRLLAIPAATDRPSCRSASTWTATSARDVADDGVFRVGYFARIAPEKGLHVLAEAYALLRAPHGRAPMRLEAAGYMAPRARRRISTRCSRRSTHAGLAGEFTYHGAVDRDGKLAFLRALDVLSVPATYDEPKGMFLLEAMATGVPVVQPRRGAFTEDRARRPAADCSSRRTIRRRSPTACTRCGAIAAGGTRSAQRGVRRRARSTTRFSASADRLLDVYEHRSRAAVTRRWRDSMLAVTDLARATRRRAVRCACCPTCRSRSRPARPRRSWGRRAAARARCSTSSARSSRRRPERSRSTAAIRSSSTPTTLAAFRNTTIGFVFQDHCLLPQCTVLENVLVPTLGRAPTSAGDADAAARGR